GGGGGGGGGGRAGRRGRRGRGVGWRGRKTPPRTVGRPEIRGIGLCVGHDGVNDRGAAPVPQASEVSADPQVTATSLLHVCGEVEGENPCVDAAARTAAAVASNGSGLRASRIRLNPSA